MVEDKPQSPSKNGGGRFVKNQSKKKNFDKRNVQCQNCEKLRRYVDECWICKRRKSKIGVEETMIAQENSSLDSNKIMCMDAINTKALNSQTWYFDTGCSNHMTKNKEWLFNFDASKVTSIKLTNNKYILA